jgi:5-methylcytosine-specific restriction endonuclease McrA
MNPWDNSTAWKSEKDFMNWLRSQTRRIWSRHPVKISYKNNRRFKAPIGINGKDVWACNCELCGKLVRSSETQIDHIVMGGSFSDWKSYTEWAKRILWVTPEDIRELCVDCHEIVNHQQKTGLSWEDSIIDKKVIQIIKEKKDKLVLEQAGIIPASNAKLRREQLVQYFKQQGEMNE